MLKLIKAPLFTQNISRLGAKELIIVSLKLSENNHNKVLSINIKDNKSL